MEQDKERDLDYEKLLDEKIAQAVLSRPLSKKMSDEEFEAWLEEGQRKYVKKRRRKGTVVASFLVCVFLSASVFGMIPVLGESSAAPDDDMTIVEQDGNLIIGSNGSEGVGNSVKIDNLPEKYSDKLIWFEDMPKGYTFDSVKVKTEIEKLNKFTITYKFNDSELVIIEKETDLESMDVTVLNNYDKILTLDGIDLYMKDNTDLNYYAFSINGMIIKILADKEIKEKEIEAMVASRTFKIV